MRGKASAQPRTDVNSWQEDVSWVQLGIPQVAKSGLQAAGGGLGKEVPSPQV